MKRLFTHTRNNWDYLVEIDDKGARIVYNDGRPSKELPGITLEFVLNTVKNGSWREIHMTPSGYRRLQKGEALRAGDKWEYTDGTGWLMDVSPQWLNWKGAGPAVVGETLGFKEHSFYRRKAELRNLLIKVGGPTLASEVVSLLDKAGVKIRPAELIRRAEKEDMSVAVHKYEAIFASTSYFNGAYYYNDYTRLDAASQFGELIELCQPQVAGPVACCKDNPGWLPVEEYDGKLGVTVIFTNEPRSAKAAYPTVWPGYFFSAAGYTPLDRKPTHYMTLP